LDSLKVLSKCGFRPLACKTRCTDALLTPQTLAALRQFHCVASGGALCTGKRSLLLWPASTVLKLRPRGRFSYRDLSPALTMRRRPSITVGRDVLSYSASALFDLPSAAPRIIRACNAMRRAVLPERTICSTYRRSSDVIANAAPRVHIPSRIHSINHIVTIIL